MSDETTTNETATEEERVTKLERLLEVMGECARSEMKADAAYTEWRRCSQEHGLAMDRLRCAYNEAIGKR